MTEVDTVTDTKEEFQEMCQHLWVLNLCHWSPLRVVFQ